jgi:hypothetical protein
MNVGCEVICLIALFAALSNQEIGMSKLSESTDKKLIYYPATELSDSSLGNQRYANLRFH